MSSHGECVLAVGSGPILVSLVQTLFGYGLSEVKVIVTSEQLTDKEELRKLMEQAFCRDLGASLDILATTGNEVNWGDIVRPFPFILYASQLGDIEELGKLQAACIAEKKPMLPAMGLNGIGMAGPLLLPDVDGNWESTWRRLHSSIFPGERELHEFSTTAAAVLSNLIVYEWHKAVTGEKEPTCINQCYILDPVTLEGSWYPFLPHPLVSGYAEASTVTDLELHLETDLEPADTEEWFSYFNRLTSAVSGIFHVWEEGGLNQLPLAQCLVQPTDPLSEGPAKLLPAIVCSGLTHVEARRESGLAGIEAYTARMATLLISGQPSCQRKFIGIGAGFTFAEAVGRGLRACLTLELDHRTLHHELVVTPMDCKQIEDVRCRFYLQALSVIEGDPLVAAGEPLLGFPVAWVRSGDAWYGSIDLGMTFALRQSLQKALMKTNRAAVSFVSWNDHEPLSDTISSCNPAWHSSWMQSAVQTLKQRHKRIEVIDMRCESFLREGPIGVYGTRIREEETR